MKTEQNTLFTIRSSDWDNLIRWFKEGFSDKKKGKIISSLIAPHEKDFHWGIHLMSYYKFLNYSENGSKLVLFNGGTLDEAEKNWELEKSFKFLPDFNVTQKILESIILNRSENEFKLMMAWGVKDCIGYDFVKDVKGFFINNEKATHSSGYPATNKRKKELTWQDVESSDFLIKAVDLGLVELDDKLMLSVLNCNSKITSIRDSGLKFLGLLKKISQGKYVGKLSDDFFTDHKSEIQEFFKNLSDSQKILNREHVNLTLEIKDVILKVYKGEIEKMPDYFGRVVLNESFEEKKEQIINYDNLVTLNYDVYSSNNFLTAVKKAEGGLKSGKFINFETEISLPIWANQLNTSMPLLISRVNWLNSELHKKLESSKDYLFVKYNMTDSTVSWKIVVSEESKDHLTLFKNVLSDCFKQIESISLDKSNKMRDEVRAMITETIDVSWSYNVYKLLKLKIEKPPTENKNKAKI